MKLSKDELLADIAQQGSTKKRPPKVARPTKRGYKSILSLWQEFALRIEQPALVPSAGCMKSFFKMLAIEHEGMLNPRLSPQWRAGQGCNEHPARQERVIGCRGGQAPTRTAQFSWRWAVMTS